MNYKLALALKEAGFPQNTEHYYENGKYISSWSDYFNCGGELIAAPTLSELIEACGDGFFNLNYVKLHAPEAYPPLKRIQEIREGNLWVANGEQCWTTAKTPEESVAKLWLKLTKK